jgi:hypothetical protein
MLDGQKIASLDILDRIRRRYQCASLGLVDALQGPRSHFAEFSIEATVLVSL